MIILLWINVKEILKKEKRDGIIVNYGNDKYFIEVNYNRTLLFIYKYNRKIDKLKENDDLINENKKGGFMLRKIIEKINESKTFKLSVELSAKDYMNLKNILKNNPEIKFDGELGKQTVILNIEAKSIDEAIQKLMKIFNVSRDDIEEIK